MGNKVKRGMMTAMMLSLILGSWKGYIAIFNQGEAEPRQIFPNTVASLPPADQEALNQGIPVRTEQQMQQLLEDCLS